MNNVKDYVLTWSRRRQNSSKLPYSSKIKIVKVCTPQVLLFICAYESRMGFMTKNDKDNASDGHSPLPLYLETF